MRTRQVVRTRPATSAWLCCMALVVVVLLVTGH